MNCKTARSSLVVFLLLSACASYEGGGLTPGVATEADVRNVMGTPAEVFPESNGISRLIYPRGPMGLETYIARIGVNGVLVSIDQVLDEKYFSQVNSGMNADEVAQLLGPPFRVIPFERRKEFAWDYRFRDLWGYVSIFSVIWSEDGKVKSTVRTREESEFHFPFF